MNNQTGQPRADSRRPVDASARSGTVAKRTAGVVSGMNGAVRIVPRKNPRLHLTRGLGPAPPARHRLRSPTHSSPSIPPDSPASGVSKLADTAPWPAGRDRSRQARHCHPDRTASGPEFAGDRCQIRVARVPGRVGYGSSVNWGCLMRPIDTCGPSTCSPSRASMSSCGVPPSWDTQ